MTFEQWLAKLLKGQVNPAVVRKMKFLNITNQLVCNPKGNGQKPAAIAKGG